MTIDDFRGFILTRAASLGLPEGHLLKIAAISVNLHLRAAERWNLSEQIDPGRSAPLWLNEHEARLLAGALKGQRGVTSRLLKQSLGEMFDA